MKPAIAHNRERGAALLVSMVLIFLLSIIGITSMQNASVENQLATNAIMKDLTFQAAESSTDRALATPNALETMICQPKATTQVAELQQVTNQETHSEIEYGGQAIVPGNSLGGPITARRFIVTGTSNLTDADTQSTVSQGVVLIGASDTGGSC
ncbi:MAG: hypothetical protein KTR35_15005 [Gammaproteobacteria bacterium]|nr:hypothetical protein [Gammaproteobacteria bacterium]